MITASRSTELPSKPYSCFAIGIDKDGFPYRYDRTSHWSIPVQTSYEEHTPNSTGSRSAWKSYEHYTRRVTPSSTMGWPIARYIGDSKYHCLAKGSNRDPWMGYKGQRYGVPGELSSYLPSTVGPLYVKRSDGGFVPAPTKIDDLRQRSFNSMLPLIKSELSLVNSVIELKDFLTLKRSLDDITRDIKVVQSVYSTVKLSARATLSRMFKANRARVRTASNAYLQHAFNLSPLVSDINGIFRSLSAYEKKMNNLITRAGSVQTRHFRYVWGEHLPTYTDSKGTLAISDWSLKDEGLSSGMVTKYQTLLREVVTESAVFHAQVRYNYLFTDYQVRHAKLLTLLDYFGVNLNPAIIWNAIPWSFVVDWVFGVGRYLDQFKEGAMQPKINIIGYLWSVKRSRRTKVWVTLVPPAGYIPDGLAPCTVLIPMVDESSYRRQVETVGTSSITSSGLSLKEISLGAALVLARRRRVRRS